MLALCAAVALLALAWHVMQDAHISAGLAVAATAGVIAGVTAGSVRTATFVAVAVMSGRLTVTAFEWQIIDAVTVFGYADIEVAMQIGTTAAAGFAAAVAARQWRRARWRALTPVLACAAGYAIWLYVPWTAINLRAVWYARHGGFERVVTLVQRGDIVGRGEVALPSPWRSLSSDGTIAIYGDGASLVVLFYTFRGVLGHAAGYAFVAGDTPPTPALLDSEVSAVVSQQPHWYFVSLF
jgi:hypothetical protein